MRLESTVIVVTGASSGLGKAMARAFVREGADVVFASRNEGRLTAAAEGLPTSAGTARIEVADVRSWESVRGLFREVSAAFGRVDVLVNNAGIRQWHVTGDADLKPVEELPVEAWDDVIRTNVNGVFYCTKAVLPGMLARGSGRIVHISSGQGSRGKPGKAAYVTSKFGVEGFHESLSLELDGTGVDSIVFRPPGGGVTTEVKAEHGRGKTSEYDDPAIVAEPAVQLAAGMGENGGRYVGTPDGRGFDGFTRPAG